MLELRHADWLDDRHREQTTEFLREPVIALASINGPPADTKHFMIMPAVDEVTDGRLLPAPARAGRQGIPTGKIVAERFHYNYSDVEITEVSERALHLSQEADAVHVVFNNNSRDFASAAAERLRRKLGQGSRMPEPPRKQGRLL